MTTVGLPDTLTYATVELASCLVTPSALPTDQKSAQFARKRPTEVLVHPTCTAQRLLPVTHGQPCDRQHEKLDLNMPLTSRNMLVEMVARAGIEPATFRF